MNRVSQGSPYLNEPYVAHGAESKRQERLRYMEERCFLRRQYQKNAEIQVDYGASVIIYVHRGQLKVLVNNAQGIEKLLYYVEEGNTCLGNYTMDEGVSLRLVTVTDCELFFLDTKNVLREAAAHEDSLQDLVDSLEGRIAAMASNLLELAGSSTKGKLCKLLYNFAQESTKTINGCVLIKQLPTREDMALFIGAHKVNVVKCLSQLEKEQVTEKYAKGIIIRDMAALERIIVEEYRI